MRSAATTRGSTDRRARRRSPAEGDPRRPAMLVPLYGFLEGDTLGLLLLAHHDTRIGDLAEKLRAAAGVRVGWTGKAQMLHAGEPLDPSLTVAESRLQALDRVDVRRVKSS